MELKRDIDYAIAAVIVCSVSLALVTIGLFSRMTPAIERIRKDNIVTLTAAHDVLAVFVTRSGDALDLADRARIEASLAVMRDNLTVDGEGTLVNAVIDAVARAQTGDREAFRALVGSISALVEANTTAMEDADEEAQRLGTAGAWTASIGGLLLVLIGVYARNRLQRRIVRPVQELTRVFEAIGSGDDLARCKAFTGAVELERAGRVVNRLLDQGRARAFIDERPRKGKGRTRKVAAGDAPSPRANGPHASALAAMLEQRPGAWVVVSDELGLIAANQRGFDALHDQEGPDVLERIRVGQLGVEREALGGGTTLVRLP